MATEPTKVRIFPGEVEINANLAVNTSTFFIDTNTNRIGIGSTIPTDILDIGSNTLRATNIQIGSVTNAFVPSGIIVIWSGAIGSIPSGWVLCDGNNGTPDFRNKFVLGTGTTYTVGSSGGTTTKTLNANELATHSHSGNTNNTGAHTHSMNFNNTGGHQHYWYRARDSYGNGDRITGDDTGGSDEQHYFGKSGGYTRGSGDHRHGFNYSANGAHSHSFGTSSSAGSGSSFSILPGYYALAFIMKQ